jgi:hypothetical protein
MAKKTKKKSSKKTRKTVKQQEQHQEQEQKELALGYVVGLDKEDKFVFQLLGEKDRKPGVLELLGLHGYATNHVQRMIDEALGVGDAKTLSVVASAVEVLSDKLDELKKLLED